MRRPVPINKESEFKVDEFFFSATDKKGIIEFGNEVFIRISAYPREEILHKAHNIIRHPDMPKSVFKIFWDTLKDDKPIAAYVKNMSADGSYYWVFALAFPIESGYLSIRFKPTSEIFKTAENLYSETLRIEKAQNMEKGEEFLLQKIKELGFENYRQFMIKAIVAELNSLDKFTASQDLIKNRDVMISKISMIKTSTVSVLNKNFSKIADFEHCSSTFTDRLSILESEFKKLKVLSVNMSILANKFGSDAASLSVIAEYFSSLSNQIENQLKKFSDFTKNLILLIEECTLELSSLKTQMNMVDFFVKESINKMSSSVNAFDEMIQTKDMFTDLFSKSSNNLMTKLGNLSTETNVIGSQLFEIQKLVNGLEIVKQTGSIESARVEEIRAAFDISLKEMSAFTSILRVSVSDMSRAKSALFSSTNEIRETTRRMKDNINEIFNIALGFEKSA